MYRLYSALRSSDYLRIAMSLYSLPRSNNGILSTGWGRHLDLSQYSPMSQSHAVFLKGDVRTQYEKKYRFNKHCMFLHRQTLSARNTVCHKDPLTRSPYAGADIGFGVIHYSYRLARRKQLTSKKTNNKKTRLISLVFCREVTFIFWGVGWGWWGGGVRP